MMVHLAVGIVVLLINISEVVMKRFKMSRRSSRRQFRRTASRTNSRNIFDSVMRGGYRM